MQFDILTASVKVLTAILIHEGNSQQSIDVNLQQMYKRLLDNPPGVDQMHIPRLVFGKGSSVMTRDPSAPKE